MTTEKLSDLLEKRRKILRLSQDEFAKLLGITQQAYGKWEAGVSTPKPSYIERIADALQMSLEDIVSAKMNQQHLIQLTKSKKNTKLDMLIVESSPPMEIKNDFEVNQSDELTGYGLLIMLASALEKRVLHQHQINALGSLIDSFAKSSTTVR